MSADILVFGGRYLDIKTHPAGLAANILGPDLIEVFSDMISLTVFFACLKHDNAARLEKAMFGDRAFFIELQLSSLATGRPYSCDSSTSSHLVRQSCRFACLIYIKLVLRSFPITTIVVGRLAIKLQEAFMDLDLEDLDLDMAKASGRLLVWCLFAGACASTGRLSYGWYVIKLTEICTRLRLWWWIEVKSILTDVVWLESDCDSRCKPVWIDVLENILMQKGTIAD